MEINFLVKGSAPEPYEVTFFQKESTLAVFCTCPAGEHGRHCKHRLAIMEGNTSAIVSNNADKVSIVRSWLDGTELEAAYLEFKNADLRFDEAKKQLTGAKRKLARLMKG